MDIWDDFSYIKERKRKRERKSLSSYTIHQKRFMRVKFELTNGHHKFNRLTDSTNLS
jgi:hypothetical protein